MASLGQLVAGVAHELNNPISFVLGNVHALARYSERLREYLAAVHTGEGAEALGALRKTLRIEHMLADLPSLAVLVVEDHPVNQEVALGFLRAMGHHCVVAATGEAALDLLAEWNGT